MLEQADALLTEFDEALWNATVENVTVLHDGSMVLRGKNGVETSVII